MKYFAFGSNMDEDQMKDRRMTINGMRSGKLYGYSLVFNKKSVHRNDEGNANIIKSKSIVEGIIYDTDKESLDRMDRREGVSGGHYHRADVSIETSEGIEICVTYISEMTEDGLKPTKKYLAHLLKGKRFLSEGYYNKLESTGTLD